MTSTSLSNVNQKANRWTFADRCQQLALVGCKFGTKKESKMAVQTFKVDDLDGSKGAETRKLMLDGRTVTIDLAEANYGKLTQMLEPFFKAGTVKEANGNGQSETAKVRAWCAANSIEVNPKGRIPENIMEKYRAAMAV